MIFRENERERDRERKTKKREEEEEEKRWEKQIKRKESIATDWKFNLIILWRTMCTHTHSNNATVANVKPNQLNTHFGMSVTVVGAFVAYLPSKWKHIYRRISRINKSNHHPFVHPMTNGWQHTAALQYLRFGCVDADWYYSTQS